VTRGLIGVVVNGIICQRKANAIRGVRGLWRVESIVGHAEASVLSALYLAIDEISPQHWSFSAILPDLILQRILRGQRD
jgi:hypothetical protein